MMGNRRYLKPALITAGTAAFMLLGRYPVAWLLSKGIGRPVKRQKPCGNCTIACPGGNSWYIEFDGREDGPPLVLIHGLNSSGAQWHYQRRYFGKDNRLIIVDLPGHGHAPLPVDLSMQSLADNLHYVLEALNIKDAIIYGHSMGGVILMQYLISYGPKDKVKGAIVHGSSYTNPLKVIWFSSVLQPLEKPVLVPLLKFVQRRRKLFNVLSWLNYLNGTSAVSFRYLFFCGDQSAAELVYTSAIAPHCDSAAAAEGLLQMFTFEAADKLKDIKLPLMVMASRYDKLNSIACARFIHQQVNGSVLRVVEGGHQSMIEHHEQVNRVLQEFMHQL